MTVVKWVVLDKTIEDSRSFFLHSSKEDAEDEMKDLTSIFKNEYRNDFVLAKVEWEE